MLLISHRGNVDKIITEQENKQSYIDCAISCGFDVEIDIRYVCGQLYLGHDSPDYEINLQWLEERKNNLWIHTKNFAALNNLIDSGLRIFYHQKENHTIINNCNYIWSHDLIEASEKSIIPLLSLEDIEGFDFKNKVGGICSDYIAMVGFK